jgi:hypothetical protein
MLRSKIIVGNGQQRHLLVVYRGELSSLINWQLSQLILQNSELFLNLVYRFHRELLSLYVTMQIESQIYSLTPLVESR